MENFFIEYRDPVFGLIIFFASILLIVFLSYIWGIFSKKADENNIEKFVLKFDKNSGLQSEHTNLLQNLDLDFQTYNILADTFAKSGYFEKAIGIYLICLKKVAQIGERQHVLNNLGKIYFKAGMLKKSADIFLEAIKLNSKNKYALRFLAVIYEKLLDFKREIEILDVLKEQGEDVEAEIEFVNINLILNDSNLKFDEKLAQISKFNNFFGTKRIILESCIKFKEPIKHIKEFPKIDDCLDVIWNLDKDINPDNGEFSAIFSIKNKVYLDDKSIKFGEFSKFFELNAINCMQKCGFSNADLSFKFVCPSCKSSLPYHFYRCPVCHALNNCTIIPKLVEKHNEENHSFL